MLSARHQLRSLSQHARSNRSFSSSTCCLVNPLQNLSHFSAAKEAQFLSKEKRIPREEFHPYLQLIRSSEVDPFAPVPGASPSVITALKYARAGEADTDTALRLAVSNLIDQVQASRQETTSVLRALALVQERFKREERNALIMLFASLGLLGFIMIKTRALSDLLDYVGGNTFDWQWLRNTSAQVQSSQSTVSISPRQRVLSSEAPAILPQPSTKQRQEDMVRPVTAKSVQSDRSGSKPLLWRLFWADPNSDRA